VAVETFAALGTLASEATLAVVVLALVLAHVEATLAYAETTLAHAEATLAHAEATLAHAEATLAHAEATLAHAEATLASVAAGADLPLRYFRGCHKGHMMAFDGPGHNLVLTSHLQDKNLHLTFRDHPNK